MKKNAQRLICLLAGLFFWHPVWVQAQTQTQTPVDLSALSTAHPRLGFTPAKVDSIKVLLRTDSSAIRGYNSLKTQGDRMIAGTDNAALGGPVTFPFTDGRKNNPNTYARYLLRRMTIVAGLYVLDGQAKWAEQAKKDLLALAAFPYWANGASGNWQFLETSALILTASYGYDWIYHALTESERTTVRNAIISKGLNRGRDAFNTGDPNRPDWKQRKSNWGLICNSGLGVGALAVGDYDASTRSLAQLILTNVRDNLRVVMDLYAPDGGGDEGLTYWVYGLEYQIYFQDALDTALGNDFDLEQEPGFSNTGYFNMHMIGPIDKNFNYSDQGDAAFRSPREFLWMAKKFNNPRYAQYALEESTSLNTVFHLLYYQPSLLSLKAALPPKDAYYRRVEVATFRSSWAEGSNTFFTGLKAGDNSTAHSHLDIGMFIIDALGQRWALDMGIENYNLPNYWNTAQEGGRWSYYRTKTEGQNTLTISASDQTAYNKDTNPKGFSNQYNSGVAPIIKHSFSEAGSFAITNMTDAYRNIAGDNRNVTKAHRGVMLMGSEQVLIQDEVEAATPVDIAWNCHTAAAVAINGNVATLTQGGKTMLVQILAPAGAFFKVESITLPAPQNSANGIKNLTVRLPGKVTQETIAIRFVPSVGTAAPDVIPLSSWSPSSVVLKPTAPGNLTASAVSANRIDLAWSDSSANETGFVVEYKKDQDTDFAPADTLPANSTRYSSLTLAANTAYSYRVYAFNAGGRSGNSNEASAVTLPNPPAAPGNVTATALSQRTVLLNWQDLSDNEVGFIVQKASMGTSFVTLDTLLAGSTSYKESNLLASTAYTYRIVAFNKGGITFSEANVTTLPSGTGLTGTYYKSKHFNGSSFTKIDSTINFDWGTGSPDPSMSPNTFSIRWTGQVEALYSEAYTFYTSTDGGVRLWVNGQLLIDDWNNKAPREHQATIALKADQKYSIQMEYYENEGSAFARLYWSSALQAKQIVPQAQLFPEGQTATAGNDTPQTALGNWTLTLYPNPVSEWLHVAFPARAAGQARIVLMHLASGQLVTMTKTVRKGENTIQIPVGQLSSGVYSVIITMGNERAIQKVVVTKGHAPAN